MKKKMSLKFHALYSETNANKEERKELPYLRKGYLRKGTIEERL
jgi:hypothetical protein